MPRHGAVWNDARLDRESGPFMENVTLMADLTVNQAAPYFRSSGMVLFVFLLALLSACGRDETGISISAVNYTGKHIDEYWVNGYNVANVNPYETGGTFVCCVLLPKHWRKDLSVKVQWQENRYDTSLPKEKVVSIPRYEPDDLGALVVHFLPGDEVKVLVTARFVGHPDYPLPLPSALK